jgi:spermidine/putrescine transport system permease protein|tara:strand:- start:24 stop:923 length:900 start_codon:yes stop_codon:yes gene_type:complete
MDSWRKSPIAFLATYIPPIFWLLFFFLIPLTLIWGYSFSEKVGIVDIDLTWTFDNYARALDPLYLKILWKSLWMAAVTTAICLVIAFPVSLVITFAPQTTRNWLLMLVILPSWINLLIRTYALIAVLRTRGQLNFGLEWIWLKVDGLLQVFGLSLGKFQALELLYNNGAVVIGLVFVYLPFMVLPLFAALDRMDKSLMEASMDLGAGRARTIMNIAVPLALPGIISGIIITFIPSLGSYLTPDLLGGTDSQMIANVIERQFKSANDLPFGSALSFILLYATFFALALRSLLARRQQDRR